MLCDKRVMRQPAAARFRRDPGGVPVGKGVELDPRAFALDEGSVRRVAL